MNINNDIEKVITNNIVSDPLVIENSEKTNRKNTKNTKQCKILSYDSKNNILHVLFEKYGIQIANVAECPHGSEVTVSYKGEIGTNDFSYSLR